MVEKVSFRESTLSTSVPYDSIVNSLSAFLKDVTTKQLVHFRLRLYDLIVYLFRTVLLCHLYIRVLYALLSFKIVYIA